MDGFIFVILYVGIIAYIVLAIRKKKLGQGNGPVKHYDTFNKKKFGRESGAMPHKHEKTHYTSMADASKLPPGYILLNGEPVREADLEGK